MSYPEKFRPHLFPALTIFESPVGSKDTLAGQCSRMQDDIASPIPLETISEASYQQKRGG